MRADPEPYHLLILLYSNGPVVLCDAKREYRPGRMHAFETKTGMIGVFLEPFVRVSSLSSYLFRQFPVAFPETVGCPGDHKDLGFKAFVFPFSVRQGPRRRAVRTSSDAAKAVSDLPSASSRPKPTSEGILLGLRKPGCLLKGFFQQLSHVLTSFAYAISSDSCRLQRYPLLSRGLHRPRQSVPRCLRIARCSSLHAFRLSICQTFA